MAGSSVSLPNRATVTSGPSTSFSPGGRSTPEGLTGRNSPSAHSPTLTTGKRKRKKNIQDETEAIRAKAKRQEKLLKAVDKLTEDKEADEDDLFCAYIASQLKKMTRSQRGEAQRQIFSVTQRILNGIDETWE